MQTRALQLRRELTPAEQKLWQCLRRQQLDGAHWLIEQKDYRVIRFTNAEVRHHIEAVLEKIRGALKG